MIISPCYHIYVNGKCVKANLPKEDFDKEMHQLDYFLDLTNLRSSATIEYEECAAPEYAEASF